MFGDVTWPDAAKARSLKAAMVDEMAHNRFGIIVSVMYSYVPFAIVFVALLRLGVRRGTMELWLVAVLAMTWILNELVFKKLIRQARPEVSCVESCGMPSSHAAFALNVWTLHLVDLLWRMDVSALRSSRLSASELWHAMAWDVLAWDEVLLWGLVWSLLLLPVPASRVFLGDHSLEQVLVGSCVGALMTSCAWMIARTFQKRYNHRLGESLLVFQGKSLLCHNMALPYSELLRRCRSEAARSVFDSQAELNWYVDQISRCLGELRLNTPRRRRLEAAKSSLENFMNRRTVHDRTQELLQPPATPLLPGTPVLPGTPLLNISEPPAAAPTPDCDDDPLAPADIPARTPEEAPQSALRLEIDEAADAATAEGVLPISPGTRTSSFASQEDPCSPGPEASGEHSERPESFMSAVGAEALPAANDLASSAAEEEQVEEAPISA